MPEPDRQSILEDLRRRGFRADRRRGQNFLFDRQLLEAVIDDTGLPDHARVLEIGAGAGTLTRRLLARGLRVVAVEIERILGEYLRETLHPGRIVSSQGVEEDGAGRPDFTLVLGDALENKNRLSANLIRELGRSAEPFHLVANLPYAIASPVVQLLLELERPRVASIGALVQAEAAERWSASPGGKEYGAISVSLSLLGRGRIARRVGRQLFSPPPKVSSAFFVWQRRESEGLGGELGRGHRLARRLFRQRRKMLRSIIGKAEPGIDWAAAGIEPSARPEQLTPEAFVHLASLLSNEDWDRLGIGPTAGDRSAEE